MNTEDNYCSSCSDLIQGEAYCRAVSYLGETYDEVPAQAIRLAIDKKLGLSLKIVRTPKRSN